MPTIKANLIVEFEADTPVQEAIDIALDQVLLLQPSCKLVSKTILEIDGEALNRENPFIHATTSTEFRHSLTTRRNGAHGDSYRPEYSERDSPQRIDNYRPSSPHGLSFQPIDSYRPNDNVSSSSTGLHPGKNKLVESPEFMHYPTAADPQSLLSIGASELGTRYDALIDSLVFNPDPQSSRPKKSRGCRRPPSHYSPPRHNRSASPPSSELRRSERLRAAESGKGLVWPSERKLSLPEAHERRRWELEQRRKEEETEQSAAEPGSLEALAPKMVAKDVAASGRLKFAKQQESELFAYFPNWNFGPAIKMKLTNRVIRTRCNRSLAFEEPPIQPENRKSQTEVR